MNWFSRAFDYLLSQSIVLSDVGQPKTSETRQRLRNCYFVAAEAFEREKGDRVVESY